MTEFPFKPIKLKTPEGTSQPFPSELRSIQAARDFVNSLDPAKRNEFHWQVAINALNAARDGKFEHARDAMQNALATEGWLAD